MTAAGWISGSSVTWQRLPDNLRDLLVRPNTGDAASWHGPYLHVTTVAPDTADYFLDAWGDAYSPNWTQGNDLPTITSNGGGKSPMTMSLVDSLGQLVANSISGTITDADNNPPGTQAMSILSVRLYYNNPNPAIHTLPYLQAFVDPSGFYEISPNSILPESVPAGIHKLVASIPGESLIRYVTSEPRSHTIVDLKFTKSFWNKLRMIGQAQVNGDGNGFTIYIANDQTDDVTISSLVFKAITPDTVYMRDFGIGLNDPALGYPLSGGLPGKGTGDTVSFQPTPIPANLSEEVPVYFRDFRVGPAATDTPPTSMHNDHFDLLFDDGSEIKFPLP